MAKSAVLFDLDNTLTPPREVVSPPMIEALRMLPVPFAIVAGSALPYVEEQLLRPLSEASIMRTFDVFACNGANRYRCVCGARSLSICPVRCFDMRDSVSPYELDVIRRAIMDILGRRPLPEYLGAINHDVIQDRGAMLNVAPLGRAHPVTPAVLAQRQWFAEYDMHTGYRRTMLHELRVRLHAIVPNLAVRIAGQTSFDIVVDGNDKRYAVATLFTEGYDALTYVGDALEVDGSDGAIVEYAREHPKCNLELVSVRDPGDTLAYIWGLIDA